MKKILSIVLPLMIYSQGALAMQSMIGNVSLSDANYDSLKITGIAKLSKVIVKQDLQITGPATLENGTSIEGSLKIIGPSNLSDTSITNANLIGPVKADNITAKKEVRIIGPTECKKCQFSGHLDITAKEATLKDSTFSTITFRKDNENRKQKLEIIGKSEVKGDIVIEGSDCEVVVGKEAKMFGKIVRTRM
ncbi:MAG: hypothetical protein HQK50_07035 [Oligoflexia bacterium]|nr:hypothetical protein [Oligoflexia bacterium]MBF0365309.1 hypothetical protein [Oligoflexia bacterium]